MAGGEGPAAALAARDVAAVLLGCLTPLALREAGARLVQRRVEAVVRRRPPWFANLQAGLAVVTRSARFHERLLLGIPQRVDASLGLVSKYRNHPVYKEELHKTRVAAGWSFLFLLAFIFFFAAPALYNPSPDVTGYMRKTVVFACVGFVQSVLTQVQDDFSIWLASWPDFLRAMLAVKTFSHTTAPENAGIFFTIASCRQLYMALYFESFSAFILYTLSFLVIPMFDSEWFWKRDVGFPLAMLVIASGMVLPAMQERVLRLEAKVEECEREKIFAANLAELERVQTKHEAEIKRRHADYICALENKHKESTQKLRLLLSYVGHEVRNAFFSARCSLHELEDLAKEIKALGQLSGHAHLADSVADATKTLGRAHGMIQSLFDDVLQMHRLETAGEVDWRGSARPFRVGAELFERARDYGLGSLRRSEVDFEASASGDLDIEIMGNPEKFMQVITNIISNAVKFTAAGSIRLKVSCLPAADAPTEMDLVFSVSDTGAGMTEEKLGKLFQPFAQARSADEFGYGGSGLGLYFARNIMRAYPCGKLEVHSRRGVGTTFTGRARLPINPKALAGGPTARRASLEDPVADVGARDEVKVSDGEPEDALTSKLVMKPLWDEADVLIVDDSQVNRALLRRILSRRCGPGTLIHEAANGQEAVTIAAEKGREISVILMDRHMPVMDGVEATRRIRKFNTRALIIAVTGNTDGETHANFLAAGCDFVWHKGSSVDSLFRLIRKSRKSRVDADAHGVAAASQPIAITSTATVASSVDAEKVALATTTTVTSTTSCSRACGATSVSATQTRTTQTTTTKAIGADSPGCERESMVNQG